MKTSGEIKVVEKMDTEEIQPDQNSLDFKMSEGLSGVSGRMQRRLQPMQELVAVPISNSSAECKETEKSVIAVLPENSEFLDATTLIDVDRINEAEEIDETGLLRVKQELCEVKILKIGSYIWATYIYILYIFNIYQIICISLHLQLIILFVVSFAGGI